LTPLVLYVAGEDIAALSPSVAIVTPTLSAGLKGSF
jgi:hypothetical protein